MSEDLSEYMSKRTSEDMSEDMPEHMSEKWSSAVCVVNFAFQGRSYLPRPMRVTASSPSMDLCPLYMQG